MYCISLLYYGGGTTIDNLVIQVILFVTPVALAISPPGLLPTIEINLHILFN